MTPEHGARTVSFRFRWCLKRKTDEATGSEGDMEKGAPRKGEGGSLAAAPRCGEPRLEVRGGSRVQTSSRIAAQPVGASAVAALAFGALALGALALGAFALGVLAVGRVAVGRFTIGTSRLRRIEIEELHVKRLHVAELRVARNGSRALTGGTAASPPKFTD